MPLRFPSCRDHHFLRFYLKPHRLGPPTYARIQYCIFGLGYLSPRTVAFGKANKHDECLKMAGRSLIAAPFAVIEVSISGPSVQRVITTTSLGPHIRSADVT